MGKSAELQEAIRRELARALGPLRGEGPRRLRREALRAALSRKRKKLLDLYYAEAIGTDLFGQEETRLRKGVDAIGVEEEQEEAERRRLLELEQRFDKVAELLRELDVDAIWAEATEKERRVLVEDLVEAVTMYPDHVEVTVQGLRPIEVGLCEVGLTGGVADCSCRRADLPGSHLAATRLAVKQHPRVA